MKKTCSSSASDKQQCTCSYRTRLSSKTIGMKYGFHVSFIQQMVLVSVSMVVICANWLTDYFASKNGGATTIFKLRMRERTVRMRDVKRDDLLQDTALVFVTAGDGDMVACVPARITGRCARVNHSTQEYVGAEVPVADTGGACPMHQRSHGVRPPLSPPPACMRHAYSNQHSKQCCAKQIAQRSTFLLASASASAKHTVVISWPQLVGLRREQVLQVIITAALLPTQRRQADGSDRTRWRHGGRDC